MPRAPLSTPEVVRLAVVGQRVGAVGGGHRLVAGRAEVDDRQAPVPEGHRFVHAEALTVGTAVLERVRHAPHDRPATPVGGPRTRCP